MPIIYTSDKECNAIIQALINERGIEDPVCARLVLRISKCMLLQDAKKKRKKKEEQEHCEKSNQLELEL